MKYYLIIFVSLLLNGCNNNTNNTNVSDNKIEVNKKQKRVTDQIIRDKQMIQNIMKYNSKEIQLNNHFKQCNPFKEYRNKLIEKSMNEPVMTQQMKEDYKKENGYDPTIQYLGNRYQVKYEYLSNN